MSLSELSKVNWDPNKFKIDSMVTSMELVKMPIKKKASIIPEVSEASHVSFVEHPNQNEEED